MATVTENWSGRSYTRGRSGQRSFVVTGVITASEAIAAVNAYGVNTNSPFPEDNRLRADTDPEVRNLGPVGVYEVIYRYVFPEQGSITDKPDDPLAEPPKFSWSEGAMTIPAEIDAEGNPLVNAAYKPIEGATTDIDFLILVVTKNQSSYNVPASIAFKNRVNSDTVLIPGQGTLEPGQLLLRSIAPTHPYDENSEYVNVAYTMWMWEGFHLDDDGLWDSWKHRILNVGFDGYYSDGGTKQGGAFVTPLGVPLTKPALLGTNGQPLDADLLVQKSDGEYATPSDSPTALDGSLFEVTANAVFLKYYKYKSRALAGLSIFA